MEKRILTFDRTSAFKAHLADEERNPAIIEKYIRDIRRFAEFIGSREANDGAPGVTYDDSEYTVTELDANADGYKTSMSGHKGTIVKNGTARAEFTNSRSDDPEEEHSGTTPSDPSNDPSNDPSGGSSGHDPSSNPSGHDPSNDPSGGSSDHEPSKTPADSSMDEPANNASDNAAGTGDNSPLELWLLLAALALTGAAAIVVTSALGKRRLNGDNGGRHTKK